MVEEPRPRESRAGFLVASGLRRIARHALLSSSLRRLSLGLDWSRALGRAAAVSLRSAAPRLATGVSVLLDRCGRAGLVAAALVSSSFPLVVAAVRIAYGVADRGRYLYYPPHWDAARRPPAWTGTPTGSGDASSFGVGGVADAVLPLRVMTYTAKPGDTLSGIAEAFGLELDTLSSLNRTWGNGVHFVAIGEGIRVPNQNGIYLAVKKTLEEICKENDVLPETVLAANGVRAAHVQTGSTLFFPGVQHRGAERELVAGTAFFYPLLGWVSSGYGYRNDPFAAGQRKAHYGVDLAAPIGTPVRAARSGTVWLTGDDAVFGKQVLVGHDFGYSTFYAHLDRISVYRGQQVTYQTVIGYVGTTGRVTGPHLHFEIRSGGAPINPSSRLAPRLY